MVLLKLQIELSKAERSCGGDTALEAMLPFSIGGGGGGGTPIGGAGGGVGILEPEN